MALSMSFPFIDNADQQRNIGHKYKNPGQLERGNHGNI